MNERMIELAKSLRKEGNKHTGEFRNFYHDRAKTVEGWIETSGDAEYRAEVLAEFETLVN